MPSGPIGGSWAAGSWTSTSWELYSWASGLLTYIRVSGMRLFVVRRP